MDRLGLAAPQKKATRLGAALIFIDETGLMLRPVVRRTWAPIGRTPLLHHPQRRCGKISAIGALSISPQRRFLNLHLHLYVGGDISEEEVIVFLREMLRRQRAHMILIWDRLKQHCSKAVREFIAAHPRLHVEYFPPYAPELNPVEGVWSELNCQRLANHGVEDLDELQRLTTSEAIAMRPRQDLLRGCLKATGLPIRLF